MSMIKIGCNSYVVHLIWSVNTLKLKMKAGNSTLLSCELEHRANTTINVTVLVFISDSFNPLHELKLYWVMCNTLKIIKISNYGSLLINYQLHVQIIIADFFSRFFFTLLLLTFHRLLYDAPHYLICHNKGTRRMLICSFMSSQMFILPACTAITAQRETAGGCSVHNLQITVRNSVWVNRSFNTQKLCHLLLLGIGGHFAIIT